MAPPKQSCYSTVSSEKLSGMHINCILSLHSIQSPTIFFNTWTICLRCFISYGIFAQVNAMYTYEFWKQLMHAATALLPLTHEDNWRKYYHIPHNTVLKSSVPPAWVPNSDHILSKVPLRRLLSMMNTHTLIFKHEIQSDIHALSVHYTSNITNLCFTFFKDFKTNFSCNLIAFEKSHTNSLSVPIQCPKSHKIQSPSP